MKRRTFKLGLLLLLGVIVNVAVAWGCVCLNPLHVPSVRHDSIDAREALYIIYDDLGEREQCIETRYTSVGRLRIRYEAGLKPFISDYDVATDSCGLPLLSLKGQWIMREPFYELRQGTLIPDWVPDNDDLARCEYLVRFLPLHPIWPGFAINTIFYAGILWMVFAMPFVVRRRRRIKRGLCPACAYPVGTSPVCTECGAAVTRVNES